jgi:hypothetical protein
MGESIQDLERELSSRVNTGMVREAAALLARGVSANTIGRRHCPLLVIAVKRQNLDMVKLLLAHGAVVWALGEAGNALECAVRRSDVEITATLLDHATPITDETPFFGFGCSPKPRTAEQKRRYLVREALDEGLVEQVILLESRGFHLQENAELSGVSIREAIRRRDWRSTEFLLRRGATAPNALWRIPEARQALTDGGLLDPTPATKINVSVYERRLMNSAHPLWSCAEAISALDTKRGELIRAATDEEIAILRGLNIDESLIEFFAHFMPACAGGPWGLFHDFVDLMLANHDEQPEFLRCGYFIFGSTPEGDTIVFGPRRLDERWSPPILRFDHEDSYEGLSCDGLAARAERIASDINEFVVHLSGPTQGR